MAKKRVHEIAKERGITSKEALAVLQKAGLKVTAPASSVEEGEAARAFGNGAAAASEAPAATAEAPAPAPKKQDAPAGDGKAAPQQPRPAQEPPAGGSAPSRGARPGQGGQRPGQGGSQRPGAPQRQNIQRPVAPEGEVRRAGPAGRGPRILQDAPPPGERTDPPARGGPRQG
ncbi:MAG TPA: translation initiation factor IF-2 N-terminal domain-containing protein, partial [Thermoleophilaceae bacterium]|nr:translation initiation factor IF-2 N-terminal domain-containing protein [Thermoleophilaceae bacterium]